MTALLAAGGWFYRSVRCDQRPGAILSSTAHIIGFAGGRRAIVVYRSHRRLSLAGCGAGSHRSPFGYRLARSSMTFVSLRPGLQLVLSLAYSSFALQTLTTVLALGIAGQLTRLSSFIAAFIATTLVIIAISAVCPAAGPWLLPRKSSRRAPTVSCRRHRSSWPVFLALRDGTLHAVYGIRSEGIITFPSLHAALGVLFPVALWTCKGRALVCAWPEHPAGDRHAGLWKPLRCRCHRRNPDCSGMLARRRAASRFLLPNLTPNRSRPSDDPPSIVP